jgi:hypothetical protein
MVRCPVMDLQPVDVLAAAALGGIWPTTLHRE